MPEQIAKRLHDYIHQEDLTPWGPYFPNLLFHGQGLDQELGREIKCCYHSP